MKSCIFALAVLFFLPFTSRSQTINDVPLKNIDVEYIEIVGTAKLFSTKLTIELDFGQQNRFWTNKEYKLKDAEGNKIEFNSMIDALNFMSKSGYELIMPYVVTVSNQNVYHYLMHRKKV
ncbi:MAG TPA: hypothetical protein VFL47_12090 [Flavisolibacter sp.]|nr:hypothetical protein [Flavisolibacter sp.]